MFLVTADTLPIAAQIGAEQQVLPHRQPSEDAATFRHVGDTEADMLVCRQAINTFSVEPDLARGRGRHPAQRAQCSGLAGAVGADQADQLTAGHRQVNSLYSTDAAIGHLNLFGFEQIHVPR